MQKKNSYNIKYDKTSQSVNRRRFKDRHKPAPRKTESEPDNFDITLISHPRDNTLAGRMAHALKNHGLKILIIHPETHKFFNSIGKSKYYCFLFSNDSFPELRKLFDQDHRYKLLLAGIDPRYLMALLYQIEIKEGPSWFNRLSIYKAHNAANLYEQVRKMTRLLQLGFDRFNGTRLFKAIYLSELGMLIGLKPIKSANPKHYCFKLYYQRGQVNRYDILREGKVVMHREIFYQNGAVVRQKHYKAGKFLFTVDTRYDHKTATQYNRLVYGNKEIKFQEIKHDEHGRIIEVTNKDKNGRLIDEGGFAVKRVEYDTEKKRMREFYLNKSKQVIKKREAGDYFQDYKNHIVWGAR